MRNTSVARSLERYLYPDRPEIKADSVLLVDNFSAHTSPASFTTVEKELKAELYPLPPNTTAACQPLDVGVMGPYKAKLRALWLRDKAKYSTPIAKRIAVIKRAIHAWDSISEATIQSAFAKAIPKPEL